MRSLPWICVLCTFGLPPLVGLAADESPKPKKDSGPPPALTERELEAMWNDLNRADKEGTETAWKHICRMIQDPNRAVPFLKARLQPAPPPDVKRLDGWIADLNSDDFTVRNKANAELEKLGPLAGPALKQTLAGKLPSLEVRRRLERLIDRLESNTITGDELRALRAMEILEAVAWLDTAASREARAVIASLAQGAAGARLTEDAKRAQARLDKGTGKPTQRGG
jgi:hypothetical protein